MLLDHTPRGVCRQREKVRKQRSGRKLTGWRREGEGGTSEAESESESERKGRQIKATSLWQPFCRAHLQSIAGDWHSICRSQCVMHAQCHPPSGYRACSICLCVAITHLDFTHWQFRRALSNRDCRCRSYVHWLLRTRSCSIIGCCCTPD